MWKEAQRKWKTPQIRIKRPSLKNVVIGLIAFLLLVVALLMIDHWKTPQYPTDDDQSNEASRSEPVDRSQSIGAKLPFLTDEESHDYYLPCPIRYEFGDKCDHKATERLTSALDAAGLCDSASTVFLVGGVNEGQLSKVILDGCKGASLHGVEIQPQVFKKTSDLFGANENVHIYHLGWGSSEGMVGFAGSGQTAHLSENATGSEMVNVTTLLNFAALTKVEDVLYTVIDVEGHDLDAVAGMQLSVENNRRIFSAFQIETSGYECSVDECATYDAALAWERWGYELYFIGCKFWWRVNPSFLKRGVGAINTVPKCNKDPSSTPQDQPMFVWGNLLVLHQEYAHPVLRSVVRTSALMHAEQVRES